METTTAFVGLECVDCGATFDAEEHHRCPDCGGLLDPQYAYDEIDLDSETLASRPFESMWRYEELLPFPHASAVSMAEGATPLVECPTLAAELGVDRVLIKDESRNPTGAAVDRGQSLAVTATTHHNAETVTLASPGNGGQSAAAYAGRAGLESTVYLPSRSSFTTKAMVNVHGGEMSVVGGRFDDALAAYEEGLAEHDDRYSLQSFTTPYRHEGMKTILYEIVEQLEWDVPDIICYPTGSGTGIVGLAKATRELETLGLIEDQPALYATQADGCAPIVEAYEAGDDEITPTEHPDTICGDLEIPDPAGGSWALEAIRRTDGGAIALEDQDILEAGVQVAANEGLECAPSSATAAAGAWELTGTFDGDETIVLVNTAAGSKEADVLRSHLMSQGI